MIREINVAKGDLDVVVEGQDSMCGQAGNMAEPVVERVHIL
jgi:hypothetical protein